MKVVSRFALVALLSLTMAAAAPAGDMKKDIVDTAVKDGRFTTLVTAVKAAGLVDTLKSEGPFTVFAPTDTAFKALPEGTLDKLLANTDELKKVLLYHVVAGNVMSSAVVNLDSAETVLGQNVNISVKDGSVMINGAKVVITDIVTSNGTIHVIDTVLVPEGLFGEE